MSFREIYPDAALQEITATAAELQLLDVREPWEYEKAHIQGVKLIPLGDLAERFQELDPAQPVLCICAGGVRSEKAAKFLVGQGFDRVTNMVEGMNGWQSRGLPLGS